ncbi:hypothetical protein QBC40DRAFT_293225 [Triangularia verruculosa]|uniref:Uncharacterized protein n=1 Tax=Triangularia verruculosa TaxID=2587418 RepID=A0AAN6XPN4_9PEZI|nr:hypothetical protein QBC40DRAFT_293225 [Triangularia verruculosa]
MSTPNPPSPNKPPKPTPPTTILPPPSLQNPLYPPPPYSPPKKPPPTSPLPTLSFNRHYPGSRPILNNEYQPPTKHQLELLQDTNEAARDKLPRHLRRGVLYKIRKGRGGGENYVDNQLPGPSPDPDEDADVNVSEKEDGSNTDEGGKKK